MAGMLGKLNVMMTAETAQFHNAMNKASAQAQHSMNRIEGYARRAGPVIGAVLAAGATAFAFQMKRIIDDADELGKMSQKIGVSVQSLSAFRHAAELAGADFEVLTKGIARLTRNASDAANGLATPTRAFEFLDISIKNVDGSLRGTEDLLLDVADRFSKMEDGTKKAALAQELFGRAGVELIPFLNEGRDGIARITAEAEKLGLIFNAKTTKAAEEFNDNITRLQAAATGLFITVANELTPVLVDLSNEFVATAKNSDELKQSTANVAEAFMVSISAAQIFLTTLRGVGTAMGDTAAIASFLYGKGGAFHSPLINAVRFRDEIGAILKKGGDDQKKMWSSQIADIEEMWGKHFLRMADASRKFTETMNGQAGGDGPGSERFQGISEDYRKMMDEGARLADSLRTPLEQLSDEQKRFNMLLDEGAISQDTFNRAMAKAEADYEKQTKAIQKTDSVMKDLGATFSSAFEDAIVEGERFSEILKGLEKDIIRILVRRKITEPLFDALFGAAGAAAGGAAGGSGFFPGLFNAKGNAFHAGSVTMFGSGGVIGSPIAFPLAGGRTGVAGEKGAEAILPLMRTSGGDLGVKADVGGRTVVNVYAPPGSEVSQDRQTDGGMERINIYIDEVTANNVRPGTKTYRAMRDTFGLGQKLNSR